MRCWNILAVENLAAICEELDIYLIHISTDFIFDGLSGPYAEDDLPGPLSHYGKSKLAGEQAVRHSKGKWAIIRTVLVYGVVHQLSRSNIVLWVKSSLEQGLKIRVVDDQWRTPTLAEDLAAGCLLAAKAGARGIFLVAGNEQMSVLQMALKVAAFWNLDASLISPVHSAALLQPAKRPAVTGFTILKAARELGYTPRTFEEGLCLLDEQLSGNF